MKEIIRTLKKKLDSPYIEEKEKLEILLWISDVIDLKFMDSIKSFNEHHKKGLELSK